MNRRDLLTATPAALVGMGAPSLASPEAMTAAPDAELLASYARWVELLLEWHRLIELDYGDIDQMDAPEVVAVYAEADKMFKHMLTLKPQTPQGFAVYCALIWEDVGPGTRHGTPDFEREAANPEYASCLALWRHVGNGDAYPDQWRASVQRGAA